MANVSNVSAPTNSSISVLVILNVGTDAVQYHTTISCYEEATSAFIGTSPNLGGFPYYNTSAKHWTQPYTFYGLKSGTTYRFYGSSTAGVVSSTTYTTTGSPPSYPPTGSPYVTHHSSSGKNITLQVNNTYGATQIGFLRSWDGYNDLRYTYGTPYYEYFTAPEYGTEYSFNNKGYNNDGESSRTTVWTTTEPAIPSIRHHSNTEGYINIMVTPPSGGWTSIEVEMWNVGMTIHYATRTQGYNYGYDYEANFGAVASGVSYVFRAIARKTSSNSGYHPHSGYGGNLTIQYIPPLPAPTGSPYVTHHSSSGRNITFTVHNMYGATTLHMTPSWTTTTSTYNISSVPTNITVIAPANGTEYSFNKKGSNTTGSSSWTDVWATSEPVPPSLQSAGSTELNTLNIRVSPSGGWTSIEVEMWNVGMTIHYATRTQGYTSSSYFDVKFGALIANATYEFKAITRKTSSNSSYHPNSGYGGNLTLKNVVARPSNWLWTTSQNANGHKISGAPYRMLATEWNDFTARVNQFRIYKALDTYPFTSVGSGGTFHYYLFNEAIASINAMNNTGLSTVNTKSPVNASNFNTLLNKINEL